MRRHAYRTALTAAAAAVALAVSTAPTPAQSSSNQSSSNQSSGNRSGPEKFDGVLVTSSVSGQRHVDFSKIVGRGVFNGTGTIVEVQNKPGDPQNLSRDDLVFHKGTLHIANLSGKPRTFTLNRKSCRFHAVIPQRTRVTGGTKGFRHAHGRFTATVDARGVAARGAHGKCSMRKASTFEVDTVIANGHLSF
ncbi:MAG: hypothetical protein ACXVEU_06005 [Nocardioidaceae bacterium]